MIHDATRNNVSSLGLETKYAPLRREPSEREEPGAVKGYASIFGAPDQNGDVVAPGAFAKSLTRLQADGGSVKLLWQHDPAQPIGVWDEVVEDAMGLFVRGRLLTEIARGEEAAALLSFGAVDGLSIGYRTIKAEPLPGGGRRLIELDLWEVSLVTFPMLPSARAGRDPGPTLVGEGDVSEALAAALAAL